MLKIMAYLMCENYLHCQGHSHELYVEITCRKNAAIYLGTGFFSKLMIFYRGIIFKIHSNNAHFFFFVLKSWKN